MAKHKYTRDRHAYELVARGRERRLLNLVISEWVSASYWDAWIRSMRAGLEPPEQGDWPDVPVEIWERIGNPTIQGAVKRYRELLGEVFTSAGYLSGLRLEGIALSAEEQAALIGSMSSEVEKARESLTTSLQQLTSTKDTIAVAVSTEFHSV